MGCRWGEWEDGVKGEDVVREKDVVRGYTLTSVVCSLVPVVWCL